MHPRLTEAGEIALNEADRTVILETAQAMANEALRVLALARKPDATVVDAEKEMVFSAWWV